MSNSNIGTIHVSMDLLARLLHFPEDHAIVDVRRVDRTPFGEFEVLCSGPTLPLVPDFGVIPDVQYTVTQTESDEMARVRICEGKFTE